MKRIESPPKKTLRFYTKKRPIRATLSVAKNNVSLHSHDYYEVEIIVSGKAIHYLNGERYEIGAGSAYIMNPAAFHSYEIVEPLKLFCINFDGSVIPEELFFKMATNGAGRSISINDERMPDVVELCKLLVKDSRKKDGGCSVKLCECVLEMILEQIENSKPLDAPLLDSGMHKALVYLNSHFYESPSLAEAAAVAGYYPSYFSEIFKKCFGESYSSRLSSLKVNYAKVLLSAGFSVSETCFRSGFRTMSSFLSVFKSKTGMSPQKYKTENRRNNGRDSGL